VLLPPQPLFLHDLHGPVRIHTDVHGLHQINVHGFNQINVYGLYQINVHKLHQINVHDFTRSI